jgi:peptidylprolyl isomerase
MQRITRSFGAVAAASVLVLTGAACSSDDAADTTTTTEVDAAAATLATIEERGEPTLGATDPATELVVTDDVEGTGAEVQPGDTITAHYTGVSASTGEVFDSSWTRGEPATFPLDGVIQGWSEGLVGMKEGGRRTLVIPGPMAYGPNPPPGSGIAPDETLVFTVDLVSIG